LEEFGIDGEFTDMVELYYYIKQKKKCRNSDIGFPWNKLKQGFVVVFHIIFKNNSLIKTYKLISFISQ